MRKALNGLISLVMLLTLFSGAAYAGAPFYGSKGAGMGTAFAAVADDPSAMSVNPAGLTQIEGTHVYGGLPLIIPSTEYTSPDGYSEETKFQVFAAPQLYAVSDFGTKDLRAGFGIFSAYGTGGRKWDTNGLTRYISIENSIATVALNPTVAYRLSELFSVAVGLDYVFALDKCSSMIDQSAAGAGDGSLKLEGTGSGWGINAGVLYRPAEAWKIGLAWRSRVQVTISGDAELENIAPPAQPLFGGSSFKTSFHSPVTFPEVITFGIAYKPTAPLTLAFDADRVRWSSFKDSTVSFDQEVPAANFVGGSSPLNWKDAWWIKAGADYKLSETLSIRGGYAFIQSPVPDETLDPSNPDADSHNLSLGLGYMTGKYTIDAYYMAQFFKDRSVNNSILSGDYNNFASHAGVSVGRSF